MNYHHFNLNFRAQVFMLVGKSMQTQTPILSFVFICLITRYCCLLAAVCPGRHCAPGNQKLASRSPPLFSVTHKKLQLLLPNCVQCLLSYLRKNTMTRPESRPLPSNPPAFIIFGNLSSCNKVLAYSLHCVPNVSSCYHSCRGQLQGNFIASVNKELLTPWWPQN